MHAAIDAPRMSVVIFGNYLGLMVTNGCRSTEIKPLQLQIDVFFQKYVVN